MQAKDIMSVDVITVREDTPISEAARLLVEHEVSGLPVVDSERAVRGIITERDVLLRHELIQYVGDTMTSSVITVEEWTSLSDIGQLLLEHGIKRVPVMRGERLVGVVSRTDVIRGQLAEDTARMGT